MKRTARTFRFSGEVAYIPLPCGREAVIDASDAHLVDGLNWSGANRPRTVYVQRTNWDGAKSQIVRLHRVITGVPSGFEVDHINGDGLDNRRSNLRVVTKSENRLNVRRRLDNSSGVKGVSWNKEKGCWQSYIRSQGKKVHLGYFEDLPAAQRAYARASEKFHGKFGSLG